MSTHPYRDAGRRPAQEDAPRRRGRTARDDIAVALLLLVVGGIAVRGGLSRNEQTELSIGLLLIGLAFKVGWDAQGRAR